MPCFGACPDGDNGKGLFDARTKSHSGIGATKKPYQHIPHLEEDPHNHDLAVVAATKLAQILKEACSEASCSQLTASASSAKCASLWYGVPLLLCLARRSRRLWDCGLRELYDTMLCVSAQSLLSTGASKMYEKNMLEHTLCS